LGFYSSQWLTLHVSGTPDDGCHPKHVELAIAKNKNAIDASCWTYLLLEMAVCEWLQTQEPIFQHNVSFKLVLR